MKKNVHAKRKARLIISILAILLVCLVIAVGVFLFSRPLKEAGSNAKLPGQKSTTADQYKAWNGSFQNFLITGRDVAAGLNDVVMIVSFNNQTGKINILQIPRDTYVSGIDSNKFNAIYNSAPKGTSGMSYLVAQVESDFGIKIDHYICISTKGLDELVDAAGGVDLTVPMNMNYDDSKQDLHIHLKKGYQHLDGSQAEQFVRYRAGYIEGDIGRLDAQKLFLAAFSDKLKNMSTLQLISKILPVLVSNNNLTTDMDGLQMIQFGLAAQKINMSAIDAQTMPGEPFYMNGISYYTVHKADLLAVLNQYFVPQGITLSESDLGIKQMVDSYPNYNNTNGDFQTIINNQTATPSSSSSKSSSSSNTN